MKKIVILLLMLSTFTYAQFPKDCSDCDKNRVNENVAEHLDIHQLRLFKNEIFARKGYVFSDNNLDTYFRQYSWYHPSATAIVKLNETEEINTKIFNKLLNQSKEYIEQENNSKYRCLSEKDIQLIFDTQKKAQLGITSPIWKVFPFQDFSGSYYLVLTEDKYKEPQDGDNFNKAIKGFLFKIENNSFIKILEINDFKQDTENSIWFWTRYLYTEDFDNDGLVEPIIVYGTAGMNGYSDGRIKILTYYKGKKYAIRIQNGVLDDERNFTVDTEFYSLPQAIQNKVIQQMDLMQENNHALYSYNWKQKMQQHKTLIKEQ